MIFELIIAAQYSKRSNDIMTFVTFFKIYLSLHVTNLHLYPHVIGGVHVIYEYKCHINIEGDFLERKCRKTFR